MALRRLGHRQYERPSRTNASTPHGCAPVSADATALADRHDPDVERLLGATFVERLAALVPRPRVHLITSHGMFAPAAPLRDRVVPPPPEDDVAQATLEPVPTSAPCAHPPTVPPTASRKPTTHKRHRYSWAELLRRANSQVWRHIEVFLCECGGQRRLLAAIFAPEPIRRILLHLGLPADPPPSRRRGRRPRSPFPGLETNATVLTAISRSLPSSAALRRARVALRLASQTQANSPEPRHSLR